jgi:hypothetical protein
MPVAPCVQVLCFWNFNVTDTIMDAGMFVTQGNKGKLSAIGGQLRDEILGRGGRFDKHAANVTLASTIHACLCDVHVLVDTCMSM